MNAVQGLMWLCSIEELQGLKNGNIGDSAHEMSPEAKNVNIFCNQ